MTLHFESTAKEFAAPGRIAVSTDLTDTEYLLPYAIAQAKASHASLVLIHAVLPHESAPIEAGAVPYYDPLRMDRDARLMLETLAREVRDQGIECAIAVRHGFVPDVVAEVVRNVGAGIACESPSFPPWGNRALLTKCGLVEFLGISRRR